MEVHSFLESFPVRATEGEVFLKYRIWDRHIGCSTSGFSSKPEMPHVHLPIWKCCSNLPEIKKRKIKRSRAPDNPRYLVCLPTPRHRRVTAVQSQASARKVDDFGRMCIDSAWCWWDYVSRLKINSIPL